jgi:hypothetical protein
MPAMAHAGGPGEHHDLVPNDGFHPIRGFFSAFFL